MHISAPDWRGIRARNIQRKRGSKVEYLLDDNFAMAGEDIDFKACIRLFDMGFPQIYLTNAAGIFLNYSITSHSMKNSYVNGNFLQNTTALEIGNVDWRKSVRKISDSYQQFHEQCPEIQNIPVTAHGKLIAWIHPKKTEDEGGGTLQGDFQSLNYFLFDNKIDTLYLSSLANPKMRELYQRFAPGIRMRILEENELEQVLHGQGKLLVYGTDLYPDGNKLSIDELEAGMVNVTVDLSTKEIVIEHKWASLSASYSGYKKVIELYDQGHYTIYRENEDGNFYGAQCLHNFRDHFLDGNFQIWNNLFVDFHENQDVLKKNLLKMFWGRAAFELAVLKNRRVVATARKYASAIPLVRWGMISDDVAHEYFSDVHRILISSESGDLKGFSECFGSWLDVVVFEDSLLDKYLSGDYDLLIYGADVWPKGMTRKLKASQIYLEMLAETARRWLAGQGVEYFNVDLSTQWPDMEFYIRGERQKFDWNLQEHDGHYYRGDEETDIRHFRSGIRFTVGQPDEYKHSVYMAGSCMVAGCWAERDEDTIASNLQREFNEANMPYRVVNAGGTIFWEWYYSEINNFYRIFHMPLRKGDVVITFCGSGWNGKTGFFLPYERNISLIEAFRGFSLEKQGCFVDESIPNHMSSLGYSLAAKHISSRLLPMLHYLPDTKSASLVTPFLYDSGASVSDSILQPLQNYLNDVLTCVPTQYESTRNGCIVMNANPFTLGHDYLVRMAASQVDILYVFIVEEDRSYFSFADRFVMAKKNCAKYKNVLVLPSGKYIISSLTFAEYFRKDDLQESVVIPTMDIDIFGRYIAPALHISTRFVGDEPLDKVTRQYNHLMRDKLPIFGIKYVELPRFELNGKPVNASLVRRLIQTDCLEETKVFLTEETYSYIYKIEVENERFR